MRLSVTLAGLSVPLMNHESGERSKREGARV